MTDNRTTELREKLTERGVEYTTNDHLGAYETSWDGFTAMQLTPGAKLMMVFTPEQAIVATLGNSRAERTCEFNIKDNMNETEGMGDVWIECSACNCVFDFYADEWLMKMSYCPNCGARRVCE